MAKIRAHREDISLRDTSRLISDLILEELTQKVAETPARRFKSEQRSYDRPPRPNISRVLLAAAEVCSRMPVRPRSANEECSRGRQSYDTRAHQETQRHFISWS